MSGAPGGSSPLARGLQCVPIWANKLRRIIPARAGFTAAVDVMALAAADHPRSRGVYVRKDGVKAAAGGSSPLARGLLDGVVVDRGLGGIIPARAGFTGIRHAPGLPAPDHPRSRGVYYGLRGGE